ncbi:MAG: hypothetical protein ABMA64_29790 [Myxococcota bacterium]
MIALALACTSPRADRIHTGSECTDGDATIVAGVSGYSGRGPDGLPATETWLSLPQDVTPGPGGRFWVDDYNNHLIREVDADGISRVIVGSGFPGGGEGGPALDEPLDHPTMALPDPSDPDVLWFAATGNHRIGRLSRSTATVSFPYGTGYPGFSGDGGPASEAWFYRPSSIAFDPDGTLYVSDRMNQVVRAIAVDGTVATVAGTPEVAGYTGDGGPATAATLNAPAQTETDPGNRLDLRGDRLVLADTGNHVVREVDLVTGAIHTLAGDGTLGYVDGPAASARFAGPRDVAIDAEGTVYVADAGNAVVRAISDGEVRTVAAAGWPAGVAVDDDGDLWIADRDQSVILRVCAP